MPLVEATLAKAMMDAYEDFKSEMKDVKVQLPTGGNNNESNGSNNVGNGSGSNSSSNGSSNTQGGGESSKDPNRVPNPGESGNQGGNGGSSVGHPNRGSNSSRREPYINPNCPIHGVQKPKKCPHCGHTDCNCNFHNPPKKEEPPFSYNGNEINPDNIEDLKKQCEEEDKAFDAQNGGNGDGNGNGNNGGAPSGPNMSGQFLKSLSKAIDDELQKATPTMTNLSILIAKGTLTLKPKSNPILLAVEISTKVIAYWTMCVLPVGIPVSGVITAVIPMNHPTLLVPFAQEILMSALQAAPGGNYQKLAEIICKYSRNCMWQVMEISATGTPVTFVVQIT